tara:strand:- start:513 stop:1028 length:516 start_codon:yes stop_codon:yes gene_type:complete
MKIKKNGKVIRLTESDLKRIVKRVLNENTIDQNGITIGDITIHEGEVYDMPYVKSENDTVVIYVGISDNIKNYESLFSDALKKCIWVNKDGETETFEPGVILTFTKKRKDIFLDSVESYGMSTARCPYKCAPDKLEVAECNKHIEPIFRGSLDLPKNINELDPKFVSLFGK